MATDSTDIRMLNSLIETTIDSADGYEQAAAQATDRELAELFRRFGSERRQVVADLRREVVSLGGDPEDDGSLLAGAHRAFLNIKSAFGSSNERVVEEVERGEDHIKDKYEAAMTEELSTPVRQAIEKAYRSVRAGHDTFSAMKHRLAAV